MVTLKKYDITGKQVGTINLDDSFVQFDVNGQMIKDYIVALRANARQWSANTKGRSEVSHSTQKPHRQKGLGRSRQGSLAAPQYKGGGRVFGPKPKFDQHVGINRKEKRLAIKALIAEKIEASRFHILTNPNMQEPKTKVVDQFLIALGIKGKRVLFLDETAPKAFVKSMRNIPKVDFALVPGTNGYELILAHDIVITEEALGQLQKWVE